MGGQYLKLAEEAAKQKHGHVTYLEALLGAEVEERERNAIARLMQEAKVPKVKTLEDFHFEEAPLRRPSLLSFWLVRNRPLPVRSTAWATSGASRTFSATGGAAMPLSSRVPGHRDPKSAV